MVKEFVEELLQPEENCLKAQTEWLEFYAIFDTCCKTSKVEDKFEHNKLKVLPLVKKYWFYSLDR